MMKKTAVQVNPLLQMDLGDREISILEERKRCGNFSPVSARPMSSNINPT